MDGVLLQPESFGIFQPISVEMEDHNSTEKKAPSSELKQKIHWSPFYGANAAYIESMYEDWIQNNGEIDPQWQEIFSKIAARQPASTSTNGSGSGNGAAADGVAEVASDITREPIHSLIQKDFYRIGNSALGLVKSSSPSLQLGAMKLIEAYRSFGHTDARTNPLVEVGYYANKPEVLEYTFYGIDGGQLDNHVDVSSIFEGTRECTVRQLIGDLRKIYCGTIGIEYRHIESAEERQWWRQHFESYQGDFSTTPQMRERILKKLIAAEGLEQYLHSNYVGQKRFSVEGSESIIVMLDQVIQRLPSHKAHSMVIGMAHRGRLNVLINTMGKTPSLLIDEFEGRYTDQAINGDVKYHLGYSADIRVNDFPIHLALAFNPSHLEIASPVVVGSCYGRHVYYSKDTPDDNSSIVPVIIHGDASFSGQGVVMETLNMSQTRSYGVGGTIHFIINNQIGFTTSDPRDTRSTRYCSDPAKFINAPILHVNGNDPEACVIATKMALDYRMRFKRDVVVDMVCYRRQGHNEADEPSITQPVMYQKINQLATCKTMFAKHCVDLGEFTADQIKQMEASYYDGIRAGQVTVDYLDSKPNVKRTVSWSAHLEADIGEQVETGLSAERIKKLGRVLFSIQDNFVFHPRIEKLMQDRLRMASGALAADWGFAELLAHASLLEEGYTVRLSGQDCGRGTFSHRHVTIFDQVSGKAWTPMKSLAQHRRQYEVVDSLLSEEAVLAFEYGYSSFNPQALIIWEAQFGDFANGAQVVIDQFISSGEQKWGRLSGLVMLLPHGYEGQGPEHSSARLERFLQLCAQGNLQVCNPTSSAQVFHLLRRQMLRKARKPLVVMSPKSLLRHKDASSTIDEFISGEFSTVISRRFAKRDKNVTRVVMCSGKIYYALMAEVQKRDLQHIALVRLEQLYPFPLVELRKVLGAYSNCQEFIWCQEEPRNQGAWYLTLHHLRNSLKSKSDCLGYAGRPHLSSPAVGLMSIHLEQQKDLIDQALAQPLSVET